MPLRYLSDNFQAGRKHLCPAIIIFKQMKEKTLFHQLLDSLIEATEMEIRKKER
jgi:hypothetical protein